MGQAEMMAASLPLSRPRFGSTIMFAKGMKLVLLVIGAGGPGDFSDDKKKSKRTEIYILINRKYSSTQAPFFKLRWSTAPLKMKICYYSKACSN